MSREHDPARLRQILEQDRDWAVYALGDLGPGFFERCEWHAAEGPSEAALILLYRTFDTPVLFTLGAPDSLAGLLDEIRSEPRLYLSIRPEVLPLVQARWAVRETWPMWRMAVTAETFRPAPAGGVTRLSPGDLPALQRLYADGQASGEAPDFFSADMLQDGVFHGVWQADELAAAAGTHLVSPAESVAAVGNVYTRRQQRGRGLGRRVTSAVTAELIGMGLRTLALNVSQRNPAALHVYEQLGYVRVCPFYEGVAERA